MSEPKKRRVDNSPGYFVVISEATLQELIRYKISLFKNEVKAGAFLGSQIQNFFSAMDITSLGDVTTENFIGLLLASKKPKFFAGKELKCDGSDWTHLELKIMGEINIAMPVKIFDCGIWSVKDFKFKEHQQPILGHLLFTPGPLLKKCKKFVGETPEFLEVVIKNKIDQNKYNKLIERRLSPLLKYANETAKQENQFAIITVPGLGCGVFAGKFKGTLGGHLNLALQYIIEKNRENYCNIACIYFDPYNECQVESKEFSGIKFRIRPYCVSSKSQLCSPKDYEESKDDDFSNCKLFKIVAWDHLSYPGNNYFVGRRVTDDGMAAAATNSMEVVTGIKGNYKNGRYLPPKGFKNWEEVVLKNNIKLLARDNVRVVNESGLYLSLNEYELANHKK